ncbi:MFS transporter [Picosynechococcus sp. NKBG042902]|uniref:MFS transporter n=1 Tax=Picosynechococcus sp. NKBG042902 TaxID=490193 RepID=UPI0004AAE8F5|nr:MFS transporter [Picosynechococcus sp. NKBG042902]
MATKQNNILWRRVMAIAAIQAAISLMWIAYRAYLGTLLGGWGFSEDFTAQLLTVEVLLAVVMEPVFGALSDRQQRFLGSRLPLISLGVILAAAIFIGLPILGALQLPLRWVLPAVAIAWALAMTMFRTPIYVLLLKSTPSRAELPLAISVLTMVIGVMGVLKPSIQNGLLAVGALPAFLAGSVTLLIASLCLGLVLPKPAAPLIEEAPTPSPLPWLGFVQTILMAIAFTWGSAIVLQRWLDLFGSIPLTLGISVGQGLNLLVAILAIPVGWLTLRWQRYPLLGVAFGWLTVILLLLLGTPAQDGGYVVIALLWAWALATVRNGTLPYIFKTIPGDWAGLGIGIFFGISGLAGMVLSQWVPAEANRLQGLIGVVCLAIATTLALISQHKKASASLANEAPKS